MKKKLMIILGLSLLIFSLNARAAWITKRLTYNNGHSEYPDIAVDSNDYIHVVWSNQIADISEIYYKKSTNGGTSWTTKRLTYSSSSSSRPTTAIDSNSHLHVVWEDYSPGNHEIYYKKSTDGGATWATKRLTHNSGSSKHSSIAIDSNNHLHIVWEDDSPGNEEIYFMRSTDGGSTWATKRLTYSSDYSKFPDIASDSNNHLHVVWQDGYPTNDNEIYYKKSTDGGLTWITKRLTYNSGSSSVPAIAADSNNHLHIVWEDYSPGNNEIHYKKSTNSGGSWTTKRLTYNSGYSSHASIAIDSDNNLCVVWRNVTSGNSEIFFKKSTNGGISWTTNRLTYNSGSSVFPDVAVDSNGSPRVVWEDNTPGNYEIYYKRK